MRASTVAMLALALAPTAQANELLSLYHLSLQNDTQLRAAAHARDAAREAKPQARGALLPQVSGSGIWSQQDDEITSDFGTGPVTQTSSSEPFTLSLNLSQTIFNWEQFMRFAQAYDRVAYADASYRSAEQNLALRLAETYFTVLAAADNLRFADAESTAVARQLEQAQKRFEVGLSAITDVQEAQARYDLTVAERIAAEQLLQSTREGLFEITGIASVPAAELREDIPPIGPEPPDIQAWVQAALDGNIDLLLARYLAEIAEKDIDISRAGHFPTLNLLGSQVSGESSGFNRGEFEQDRLSLQLSVPIFSGGITQSFVDQSQSIHEQRLAELEGTKRAVERRTRDAYQGVLAAAARARAFRQAVISNQTALEASETGLSVGTRTSVDVLNAQGVLYRAQRDYARARYDLVLNVLRLKAAAGRLGEPDVAEIDRLLTTPTPTPSPTPTP